MKNILTKTPDFRITPAATLKANPGTITAPGDKKVIFDYSLLSEALQSIDFNIYNHISLSAANVADKLSAAKFNEYLTTITINIYPYTVIIETIPQPFSIYDQHGRQKYRYFYFDNMRLNICHAAQPAPLLTETINPHRFTALRHYEEINV